MKAKDAKELFRQLVQGYFSTYEVRFANQSRAAKGKTPLIVLSPGAVKRPVAGMYQISSEGLNTAFYESRMNVVVDLFTNGEAITDDDGTTVAYENTAMDELLELADYINSLKCVDWCKDKGLSLIIDTDAQDLTGIVNDTNYEYRARLEVIVTFTYDTTDSIGTEDMGSYADIDISAEYPD